MVSQIFAWIGANQTLVASWITIAQGIVTIPVLIIGTIIAWNGLSTWKAQISAKAEYDLARRVVLALYKLRDAMRNARVDFEFVEYYGLEKVHKLQASLMNEVAEAKRSLTADLLEASVLWDKDTLFLFHLVTSFSLGEFEMAYTNYYSPDSTEEERKSSGLILFTRREGAGDDFESSLNRHVEAAVDALRSKLTFGAKKPAREGKGWMTFPAKSKGQ